MSGDRRLARVICPLPNAAASTEFALSRNASAGEPSEPEAADEYEGDLILQHPGTPRPHPEYEIRHS